MREAYQQGWKAAAEFFGLPTEPLKTGLNIAGLGALAIPPAQHLYRRVMHPNEPDAPDTTTGHATELAGLGLLTVPEIMKLRGL